jgi:hypothetical protein
MGVACQLSYELSFNEEEIDNIIDSVTYCLNAWNQNESDAFLHSFEDDSNGYSCSGCTFESDINPSDPDTICESWGCPHPNVDTQLAFEP